MLQAMKAPAKRQQPRICIEDVDPALAKLLLEKNRTNRLLRSRHVDKYAEIMKAGQWLLNNDAIVVSCDDALLNGQHRLHAVIKSGCTVKMLMLWHADPRSFETMDRALTRSVADALGQLGCQNTHTLAAALKAYMQVVEKRWDKNQLDRMEPSYAVNTLQSLPGFPAAHRGVVLVRGVITPGLAMALYYRLQQIDPQATEEFLSRVGTGENLALDSPIYRLRERLRRTRGVTIRRDIEAALCIKAWNAWRTGRKLQALGWRNDEAFPDPL